MRSLAGLLLIGLVGCGGTDAAPRSTLPLASRLVVRLAPRGRTPVHLHSVRREIDGAVLERRTVDDADARDYATELFSGPIVPGAHQVRVVVDYDFRYSDVFCHYGAPSRASTVGTVELAAAGDTVLCVRTGARSIIDDILESLRPRIDHDARCDL